MTTAPFVSPKVVVDTNILVSGGTVQSGYPAQVIDLWRTQQITLVTSDLLMKELEYVLSRPALQSLGWMPENVEMFLDELRNLSLCVAGTTRVSICRDPNDDFLFACAVEGRAQFIVSGDADVLAVERYKGIETLKPRDFVEWFHGQRQAQAA